MNKMITNFDTCIERKQETEKKMLEFSRQLQAFPKGAMGLTPDHIKKSEAFQAAKRQYDLAFNELRRINGYIMKHHKKAYLKLSKAQRLQKLNGGS